MYKQYGRKNSKMKLFIETKSPEVYPKNIESEKVLDKLGNLNYIQKRKFMIQKKKKKELIWV